MSRDEWSGVPYPPKPTIKEIVLIRHAESQANLDGVWNGRNDGPLSLEGQASLDPLGKRLSAWSFDFVISSPLTRARLTAESFADDIEIDEALTEIDLGEWEGMTFVDVRERHGEELSAALSGEDLPMGGTGETIEMARARAIAAVDALFDRLGDHQRAAVVTHGGFLQGVLHRHLAGDGRRPHAFLANTSLTRLVWQFGRARLASFNDTAHLGPRPASVEDQLTRGNPVLAMIRHGQTRANVERRWQGQGDWDLDDLGHRQAAALGEWYGQVNRVYSSPLRRAMSTAAHVACDGVVPLDGLMELNMGTWEGLTSEEIMAGWPGMMERIYRQGEDLPRGETGESWGQLAARIGSTLAEIQTSKDEPTVVVAHGGAIRSFISTMTVTADTHSESLYTPANTGISHVSITPEGPVLLDYSVAMHLETPDFEDDPESRSVRISRDPSATDPHRTDMEAG